MKCDLFRLSLGALALSVGASFADAGPLAVEPSADIPMHAVQGASALAVRVGATPSTASVTDADVGDSDSFGRNLQWLGVTDMNVILSSDCTGTTPPAVCQVISDPTVLTTFSYNDLNKIALPKNAANSLLCYWLSPLLTITYTNPTAAPVIATLNVRPTLTVENPLLNTPGLIDPTTGVAFGGSLQTSMTSFQIFQVPVPAGLSFFESKRDSSVCIAGFLSRSTLVQTFGLTNAQAKDFFNKPTTVHLNLAGSSQYISDASLYYGFRIIGD